MHLDRRKFLTGALAVAAFSGLPVCSLDAKPEPESYGERWSVYEMYSVHLYNPRLSSESVNQNLINYSGTRLMSSIPPNATEDQPDGLVWQGRYYIVEEVEELYKWPEENPNYLKLGGKWYRVVKTFSRQEAIQAFSQ